MWCIVQNIMLLFVLNPLSLITLMILLHHNLDGSLSRQVYLQVKFDLLLDRFDTSSSPFLLVLKLESVRRSFKRCLLSWMVMYILKVLWFRLISSVGPMFAFFPIAVSLK